MMMSIIRIKEKAVVLYRNHETVVLFALKFLMGLVLFGRINSVGYFREGFSFAGGALWTLGLSALFAVAPPTAAHLVLLLAVMIQISLSLELTLVVFLIGACILIFYCRLQPQRSFIILAMLLGFYFRIPYAVVLVAGLYVGFAAIIPVAIGSAIWGFLPLFSGLAGRAPTQDLVDFDMIAATDSLAEIYISLHAQFTGDFLWVFNSFIFAMVIISVYAVSRLTINYSKEISLILGGVLCIFGVIMSSGVSENAASTGSAIFFTLLSVVLAQAVRFFDLALDYKKVEYVEFEDEDNYYYVKIINKLKSPDAPVPAPARVPRETPAKPHAARRAPASRREPEPRRAPRGRAAPKKVYTRRPPPPESDYWDEDH